MPLTHAQKKFIKKNIREKPLASIASDINVDEEEILGYLRGLWRKEKYIRYVSSNKNEKLKSGIPTSGFVAPLKTWLIKERYFILGLLALVFLVYANSLDNAFVSDDISGIQNNPNIRSLNMNLASIRGIVNSVIYYVAYKIGGLNPSIFRLFNIVFHAANVILVYLLFYKIRSKRLAIIVASLFAVHPILTESITWISGGGYARYTFFFLLSFIVYIFRPPNLKTSLISGLLFLLSIFTSEKAVPLAVIYPLYDHLFRSDRLRIRSFLPHLMISSAFVLIYFNLVGQRISSLKTDYYLDVDTNPYANPIKQVPVAISEYFRLIFWPSGLTLYHSEMTFTQQEYLARLIVFITFMSVILYAYWRVREKSFSLMVQFWKTGPFSKTYDYEVLDYKFILFWMIFFIVGLALTLTPLRISWIVAERYVYVSSIGIFAIFALFIEKFLELGKGKYARYVYTVFAVAIVFLSWRTIQRNHDWQNQDTLWIATAKTSPSSPNTHNNMGDVYARHGEYDKAVDEFKQAIKINGRYADAYHNLGNTYKQMADLAEKSADGKAYDMDYADLMQKAVDNFALAVKYNPKLWQSYQSIGAILFDYKKYSESIPYFQKAYSIKPSDELAYNLAIANARAGNIEEAKTILIKLLAKNPTNQQVSDTLRSLNSLPSKTEK